MDWWQLAALMVAAVLIGVNKTALPGIGLLPVVLLSLSFETRMSTGLQLGMLAMADIMAVVWYRRSVDWRLLAKLLPWALVGLALGAWIIDCLPEGNDRLMRLVLGGIVLFLAVLGFIRSRFPLDGVFAGRYARGGWGILMGSSTMVANAAGPVASIYLLAMRLPKEKFLGCNAWLFLILNWIKLPVFVWQGRITAQSAWMDVMMIPFLLVGGALGILLLRRIPQKVFENIIQVLIVISALRLLLS